MHVPKRWRSEPPSTQIEISAQAWECQACGGRDPKSCSCNSTAIMVALREAADKHAAHKEADRQYQRRKRAASTDAPVEKTKESGNGPGNDSAMVEKPNTPSRFERKDIAKLINGLIHAGLARDLLGVLKAHGATFVVKALEAELKAIRKEIGDDTD